MADKLFHDPQLTQFYDLDNPWDRDKDFVLAFASGKGSVLDLGCGTGELAVALADGRRVAGVEPAAAMLDIAQARPGGEQVRWVEADARSVRLDERFDLVVMTGHAFQCLLGDDDQLAVCRTIVAHLAPGGTFIFDSRNPVCEEWRSWVPGQTARRFGHPELGEIEAWNDVRFDVDRAIATYDTFYRAAGGGEVWQATSRIRFAGRDEIATAIAGAGLQVNEWLGDWEGGAWHVQAPEIIPVGSLA